MWVELLVLKSNTWKHFCPRYDSKLHLMMRVQSWNLGNVEFPFSICLGPIYVLNRTSILNYLMVMRQSRISGECGVLLHYHYSQVHCDLKWLYTFGSYLCIKENKPPEYDTKLSDGEAAVLDLWGMWSIPSLPLLPGTLRPEVVVYVWVLSMY